MEWFESWFDTPYYHILYQNHDYREAEDFIIKLTDFLHLEKNAKIIDLACGKGRHSVFLNKLGFDVLGLDLSPNSIEHNKKFENETLHFEVHDMRNPINAKDVDAVLNMFTSFGYFETEEEDRSVFNAVSAALKKDGYFVLDFLNADFVSKNITENSVVERGKMQFNIHKKIEDHYIIKEINFEDEGKSFQFVERVKLHTPEKINSYAENAGLVRMEVFGDYQLSAFNPETSPRCITVFKKK